MVLHDPLQNKSHEVTFPRYSEGFASEFLIYGPPVIHAREFSFYPNKKTFFFNFLFYIITSTTIMSCIKNNSEEKKASIKS